MKPTTAVKEYRLANGLRVFLHEAPAQTLYIRLRIDCGTANELAGEEGFAHFVEHILFTGGSRKYSPDETITMLGEFGQVNASTDTGKVVLYIGTLPENIEKALDFMSEIMFYPRFDEKGVNSERERVLRELALYKGAPPYNDEQEHRCAFFGKHPCSNPVLGNEKVIANATIEQLKKFYARGFTTANATLIVTGNIPADAERLIDRYFGEIPAKTPAGYKFPFHDRLGKSIEFHKKAPDLFNTDDISGSNANIILDVPFPPETSEDYAYFHVLSTILSCGANSRLFKSLSLDKGLGYGFWSMYIGKCNCGDMKIMCDVLSKRREEALGIIFAEIAKLRVEPVPKDELESAKTRCSYDVAKNADANEGRAESIEHILDSGVTTESVIAALKGVTSEKLLEISKKYLPPARYEGEYALLVRYAPVDG